uniref:Rx N-terminal domain-containing protein n=1 Tax=Fagus sylvatica TaxID=28930 RepID=A0A2N9HRB0_FAGSY
MAEGVLFDLAGKVLEVAGSFALQEIKLASGVKADLEQSKEHNDLLDDFSTEALQREVMTGNKMTKEVRIFFSSSNQLAYSLKMGHRIKAIRERLNVIENDKEPISSFIETPK